MKQWLVLIIIALCFWGVFEVAHGWLLHHPDQPDARPLKVVPQIKRVDGAWPPEEPAGIRSGQTP
jgi:hypothetical protein